jgi:uncharacterized membrane protein (DUF2068 family)
MPAAQARPRALALIALYKLAKTVACIALGFASLHLTRSDVVVRFDGWLESLAWATRHGLAMHAVDWLLGMGPRQYRLLGLAAWGYALLYAVQGVGLWFGRRWAEYLVVVETGLLLPLELWELARRFSPLKLGVLAVNVAVVAYLVWLLRTRAAREPAA